MKRFLRIILLLTVVLSSISRDSFAVVPTPDHVVIVVLENHGYSQIVGSPAAPYLNGLLSDSFTAWFTNSVALSHPSQPNYLQFHSGSTQGVTDDAVPTGLPFTTLNLGGSLLNASRTFIGYSEDLPSVGYNGATSGAYARKHNPWVNWQGASINGIPTTSNQPLTSFPTNFDSLPTVSYVIPNQDNDMHNGSDTARIGVCDRWMKTHLNPYIQWSKTHNSLFILTFDEDDNASVQHILTFFTGNFIQAGSYNNAINHYNVLRTIEDMYGLTHAGNAASAATIDYVWNTCNLFIPTVSPNGSLTICSGTTVTLTTGNATAYLWSNGATTSSIVVSTAGNYSVTCTYPNGCKTSSAPVSVSVISAQPDATLFNETMGTVGGTTAIATQETNNGFDNDNLYMSGTGDLRITSPSSGYATASGGANVFLTNTAGKNFIIDSINTTGLINLELSFGIYKSTTTNSGSNLAVQVSSDGTTYANLSFTPLPTGTGTAGWYYRTATGTIPSVPRLRIQFFQNSTTTQHRIDDVLLKYSSVPVITANGPTTLCQNDSVTLTSSAGINYSWSTGATTQSIVVHTAGSYSVTANCMTSSPVVVTLNNCPSLNLKVFIEGLYLNNGQMRPSLFTSNLNPDPTACDSITIELHNSASPYNLVASKKTLLHKNGQAVAIFPYTLLNGSYYIAVRNRNALETWSKLPVLFNSTSVSFDFTSP